MTTTHTATTFERLGVDPRLAKELSEQGILAPFPVQALTIPDGIAGRDVCGKAKTGSGKTLAFGIPLLMTLGQTEPGRPGGLVLVPTRELAQQVHEVLKPLAEAVGRRTVAIYGGADIEQQTRRLKKGSDVVIATPGRLIDLIDRNEISVAGVEAVVIDEADRMADMGFLPQVDWVLRRIESEHQTMLFSATLDGDVNRLVKRHLKDPVFHQVESPTATVESMEHRFLLVHEMDKVKVAAAIAAGAEKTIMFVRTKRGADKLALQLNKEGIKASAIHGDLRQTSRDRALDDFAKGRLPTLVATDVAARGLDIEDVGVVIHFDPPEDHKAYVHRSGRTARAGDSGVVATLVLWNQVTEVERIQKRIGLALPIVEVFSNNPHLADLAGWQSDEGAA